MGNDKTYPEERRITLGPEVWQRVFASTLYRATTILGNQIFKRTFLVGDFDAMGLTGDEWKRLRGPSIIPPTPFPFCELILSTDEGRRRCRMEDKQSFARMSSTGKIDLVICHAGLTELGIPIIFRERYYGYLGLRGGLLLHEPNQAEWQKIAERVKDTGVDLESLKKAYFEITPISKELFDVMIQIENIVLGEIIKAAVEAEEDKKRIAELESVLYGKYNFDKIIGKSPAMQDVLKLVGRVIESDSPVLLEGGTGTGKELIASTIHYNSPRKDKSFTAINCGGMTETLLESELFGHIKGSFTGALRDKKGLFEVADKGTVFLDEIAEMSPALQVKLLRVLQEGTFLPVGATEPHKVDVRVISATNKNLKELVNQGRFREDLYYRLNVIKVSLPPLRERKEDIPLLINHFIKTSPEAVKKKIIGVRPDVLKYLLDFSWPGNIRELQNVLERAVALTSSQQITIHDLPPEIIKKEPTPSIDLTAPYERAKRDYLASFQRKYLSNLLSQTNGNIRKAARLAGLSRAGLQKLMRRNRLKLTE